ncbi:MAG: TIGR03960 family B12-binding radical SAM protein [Candidatus Eisenbacteria bacterium]|uniref:TIGR03960 family B12-binding radical SAM protein n=1 Tax=Eiseniibacteriota bacterium TaxID=2212470 RepID=A0A956NC99_UNCEI|nr:TIGR03960 family B12-binding radical SAM protein [Candidatus Eisenbacteria bacterium]MCB9465412.1 TIGR03960 family B12-binding radical SAM protein [Candidatus Eisenbacteria bacterium]
MPDLEQQLDTILPLVAKPSRYLGNEFHVIRKQPEPGMVQWCLLLPEVYEIGMSHWGLKILYEVLNRRPDSLAERAYSPWFDMEAQLRRHEIPLYALESKRPLAEFDFVGFSLQYELTYTNILQCLDLAGLPLRSADRRESDPIVIAGGPVVSNPEPLSSFIDMFLIGDGEEMIHRITDLYKETRDLSRHERLRAFSKLPGIYVPSMYEAKYSDDGKLLGTFPIYDDVPKRVLRQFVIDLENAPVPEKPIVPLQDIVQNRLSIEVLRGCTQGCRFCQAGYLYRPIRERSVEKILEIADAGIRESGWDEIGLTSLSTADYTQLGPLADVLNERFSSDRVALSLPSLRADSFGVEIADKVKETKKTGFTFAPEVGSERLRLAVNKLIRDQEFFDAAEIAFSRGWRLIKMYFMIGLPTEQWEDVDGVVHFIDRVREIGRRHGRKNSVNASIGSFVPKSHTPFQWDAFEPVDLLKEKIRYIRSRCHSPSSRVKWHDVETSHLEAIFSKGDRRLGPAIEWAYRHGARFDGWTEHFDYDRWMRAFEETGVDVAHHTGRREFTDALPWDHIDIRVSKKWLQRERKKTEDAVLEIGESLVTDCRHGDCTACGIPGLPFDTQLTPPIDRDELGALKEKARQAAPRRAEAGTTWPVRVRFQKVDDARFLSHLEMGAVLARAFRMARIPVAHSQGHKPRPKIAFGPSLSVGIETVDEYFDVELLRPWIASYAAELSKVLPRGIQILDGATIPVIPGRRRPSLASLVRRARYRIELGALEAPRQEAIFHLADELESMDECLVERSHWNPKTSREATDWETPMAPAGVHEGDEADTSRRTVDLRKAIESMSRAGETQLDVEMFIARDDGQVCNPKVVLERYFHLGPEEQARVRIRRIALLREDGEPIRSAAATDDLPEPVRLS